MDFIEVLTHSQIDAWTWICVFSVDVDLRAYGKSITSANSYLKLGYGHGDLDDLYYDSCKLFKDSF